MAKQDGWFSESAKVVRMPSWLTCLAVGVVAFASPAGAEEPLSAGEIIVFNQPVGQGAIPNIRRIDPETGAFREVQTNFNPGIASVGIAIESPTTAFVTGVGEILEVDFVNETTSIFASGGLLTHATAITLHPDNGDLILYDNARILRVNRENPTDQTVISAGEHLLPMLSPYTAFSVLVEPDGTIFALGNASLPANGQDLAILRIDPVTGAQTVIASGGALSFEQGPASNFEFSRTDESELVMMSSDDIVRIHKITGNQTVISPPVPSSFDVITGMALEENDDVIAVDYYIEIGRIHAETAVAEHLTYAGLTRAIEIVPPAAPVAPPVCTTSVAPTSSGSGWGLALLGFVIAYRRRGYGR